MSRSEEDIVAMVQRQTTYTEDEIICKLRENNGDYLKILKEYMNISDNLTVGNVKSASQERYKQMRQSLDAGMQEYRNKNPIDQNQLAENLEESDFRESKK